MRRLAWTCGGFCGAIFLAHYALPPRSLLIFALLAAGLSVAFGMTGKETLRRLVLCFFGAALGVSWYAIALRQIAPLERIPWEERVITARVTEYPKSYDDSVSLTVRITSPELSGRKARLTDYYNGTADLRPGDEIRARVKLRSGAIHFGRQTDVYLSKGVELNGYLRQPPEKTGVWHARWLYFPQRLSHALVSRAEEAFPSDVAAFAKALMLGEKQALYAENLDIPLKNAGIMHAVAVSGMHLAFLLGFFRAVGGRGRRAALLTIPALALFVVMAGASPSVVRAALMATLFLLAPLFHRETDGPTSLMTALAVLLAANPFSAGSISLQLSFGALAGILLVSERLVKRWRPSGRRPEKHPQRAWYDVRRYVSATLATTIGAMLFTIPLSAVHFGTVALAAPITNLLILWMLPYAFLGCYGVVALSFLVPVLGRAAGWLAAWALRFVLLTAKTLGSIRALQLSTGDWRIVAWLAAVYLIFLLAWRLRRFPRWKYAAALGASCALLVLAVSLTRAGSDRTPRVAVLDVGQGQCLVFCSGGKTVMVDCGGGAIEGNAGDVAAQYLCAGQRSRVDVLYLTHPHQDHVNGVCRLMLQIPVGRVVVPAAADPQDEDLARILNTAQSLGVEIVRQEEDAEDHCGDFVIRQFVGIGREREDGSMVLRISRGDFDTLVTGDLPIQAENELAEMTDLSGTELLIVGHHGSPYATGNALLDALEAQTAVVSCGYNSYGHPAQETLSRLQTHDITIYRTDRDGTVTVRLE